MNLSRAKKEEKNSIKNSDENSNKSSNNSDNGDNIDNSSNEVITRCVRLFKYDVSIALKDTDRVVWMIKQQMEGELSVFKQSDGMFAYMCVRV